MIAAIWTAWILAQYVLADPHCMSQEIASWYGSPDYASCRALLFGEFDLNGIAAIDGISHAYIVPNMEREHESPTQWDTKVELPRLWGNRKDTLRARGQFIPSLTWDQTVARSRCYRFDIKVSTSLTEYHETQEIGFKLPKPEIELLKVAYAKDKWVDGIRRVSLLQRE